MGGPTTVFHPPSFGHLTNYPRLCARMQSFTVLVSRIQAGHNGEDLPLVSGYLTGILLSQTLEESKAKVWFVHSDA